MRPSGRGSPGDACVGGQRTDGERSHGEYTTDAPHGGGWAGGAPRSSPRRTRRTAACHSSEERMRTESSLKRWTVRPPICVCVSTRTRPRRCSCTSTRISSRRSSDPSACCRSEHSVASISARRWRTPFEPATPHTERSTPASRRRRDSSSSLLGTSRPPPVAGGITDASVDVEGAVSANERGCDADCITDAGAAAVGMAVGLTTVSIGAGGSDSRR